MAQVSSVGFFPFCITETSDVTLVGTGTSYPIQMTLQEAVSFYWKTKTLDSSGSFSYQIFGNPTNTFPDGGQPFQSSTQYSNELQLACGTTGPSGSQQNIATDGNGLSFSSFGNGIAIYKYQNFYYPYLVIENLYSGGFQTLGRSNAKVGDYTGESDGYGPLLYGLAFDIPVTLNGITYQVTMVFPGYLEDGSLHPGFSITAGDYSIFQTATWPYNP